MRRNQTGKTPKDPNSTNSLIVRAFRYRAVRVSVGVGLVVILLFVAFTGPDVEPLDPGCVQLARSHSRHCSQVVHRHHCRNTPPA